MGTIYSLAKKLFPWTFFLILPLTLFNLCCNPLFPHSLSLRQIKYSFPQSLQLHHTKRHFPTRDTTLQYHTKDQLQDRKSQFPTLDRLKDTTKFQFPTHDITPEYSTKEKLQDTKPTFPTKDLLQGTAKPQFLTQGTTPRYPKKDQLQKTKPRFSKQDLIQGTTNTQFPTQDNVPQYPTKDQLKESKHRFPKKELHNGTNHQVSTQNTAPPYPTKYQLQDTKSLFPIQELHQGTNKPQFSTQDTVPRSPKKDRLQDTQPPFPKQDLLQGTKSQIPTQEIVPQYPTKDHLQNTTPQSPKKGWLQDNKPRSSMQDQLKDDDHKSLAQELQGTKPQNPTRDQLQDTKPQSSKPDKLQDDGIQSPKDPPQENVPQLPTQVKVQETKPQSPKENVPQLPTQVKVQETKPQSPIIDKQEDRKPQSPTTQQQFQYTNPVVASKVENETQTPCDYSHGRWVYDKKGPLYNDKKCDKIKEGQKCVSHGRRDLHYLYWRWKPRDCKLPRFEPNTFLQLFTNKYVAFVGDSLARNQLESLVCMLGSASTPKLVYRDGEENKFRRWHFDSHNFTISIYWSPFLVHGIEKLNYSDRNQLHLDKIDERWGRDLEHMDMIVLSFGHWFLLQGVYFENDSPFGCHLCSDYDPIGFLIPLRKALKTVFKTIIQRRGVTVKGKELNVVLTTFSPSHFDGEWDNAGACPKTMPYKWDEKVVEGMNKDIVNIEMEEFRSAKEDAKKCKGLRLEVLDVTGLSLMRPDAHPGPYMTSFPFANKGKDRIIANDCVHWCLPGAIDTWNELLLELVKK